MNQVAQGSSARRRAAQTPPAPSVTSSSGPKQQAEAPNAANRPPVSASFGERGKFVMGGFVMVRAV